jgi:hypothetical protein
MRPWDGGLNFAVGAYSVSDFFNSRTSTSRAHSETAFPDPRARSSAFTFHSGGSPTLTISCGTRDARTGDFLADRFVDTAPH